MKSDVSLAAAAAAAAEGGDQPQPLKGGGGSGAVYPRTAGGRAFSAPRGTMTPPTIPNALNNSHSCGEISTSKALHINLDDNPNLPVYLKMEAIVKRMQGTQGQGQGQGQGQDQWEEGVPVRTVKSFMTKIPNVFTGQDLVQWMLTHLELRDTTEALLLANRMAACGYFFPIDDHVLAVKNDNTYYRFQTPYFWPSKSWAPENTDYAVYLCKRTLQNKSRLELADYEAENLARLRKMFSRKWEYIFKQAEAQSKIDRKRDKQERKILDTQERAFWDVYRPPPGCVNTTELDIKKVCRKNKYNVNDVSDDPRDVAELRRRLEEEVANLRSRVDKCTIRVSKCAETYVEFFCAHGEYDAFLRAPEPQNPWVADSTEYWEVYDKCTAKDQIAERRVRKWGFSCWSLLRDPVGRDHFRSFLEKEYATENLLFVEAVWRMKKMAQRDVAEECQKIWKQFLGPGAEMLVNVDSKTHRVTEENMRDPDRWTFDDAAAHLYYLMTSDSYSRYLRSSHYKDFLEGAKKRGKSGSGRAFGLNRLTGAAKQLNIASSTNNS